MIVHKVEVIAFNPPPKNDNPCGGNLAFLGTKPPASAPKPQPENPSLGTKIGRLRKELTTWIKAGAHLVPKEVRAERWAHCSVCEYYDKKGNLGLGACSFPSCGCTKAKLALATSKCPHIPPKWGAWGGSAPKSV